MASLKAIILVLTGVSFLVSCSGGGSGGAEGDARPPAKKPVLVDRPVVPEQGPFVVQGPDSIQLHVPAGAQGSPESILLHKGSAQDIQEGQETVVSPVVRINLLDGHSVQAKREITLRIPLGMVPVVPTRLMAKVRLSTGVVLPVLGVWNSTEQSYDIPLASLVDGWSLAVVQKEDAKILRTSQQNFFTSLGWLTDLNWETCDWSAVIHNDMTEEDVSLKILPEAKRVCESLSALGVRAPRLWVTEQGGIKSRILHVVNTSSFFSHNPLDEDDEYLSNASEEEMLALGQMYISYRQYEDLNRQHGITLGNILIHELFHGVQWGYDLRYGRQGNITSLKAYNEGTSTPLGQTYQQYLSISGPRAIARDLGNGEHMYLDEAVDSPWSKYYTKQSFFAYVASRWNQGSFSYVHQLYEQMAVSAYAHPNLSVKEYLPLYRDGMDKAFRNEFGKSLRDIYSEFAEDRAFVHSPASVLHKIDQGLKRFTLAETLFANEIKSLDYILSGNTRVEYTDIAPLSMRVMKILPPADLCTTDCPAENILYIKMGISGLDESSQDFRIVTYAVDATTQEAIPQSRREIRSLRDPVAFKVPRGKLWHHVVLIMNASVSDHSIGFTAQGHAGIDYVLPQDVTTGDSVAIYGAGFGEAQGGAQVLCDSHQLTVSSWSAKRIQVVIPPEVPSKKCQLFIRWGALETNKVLLNIRSSGLSQYKIYLDFDSRAISGKRITLPIFVANKKVTFRYSESGKHGEEDYTLSLNGEGSYDGKIIQISGSVIISTKHQMTIGKDIVVTTEKESMTFKNANGKWVMNIFLPGKTESSSAHYIYHREEPRQPPTHIELQHDPDVQIWDWVE